MFPPQFVGMHDVFHVSMFRKCEMNPSASKKGETDTSYIVEYCSVEIHKDMSI